MNKRYQVTDQVMFRYYLTERYDTFTAAAAAMEISRPHLYNYMKGDPMPEEVFLRIASSRRMTPGRGGMTVIGPRVVFPVLTYWRFRKMPVPRKGVNRHSMTCKEVATVFACSPDTISYWRKNHGMDARSEFGNHYDWDKVEAWAMKMLKDGS